MVGAANECLIFDQRWIDVVDVDALGETVRRLFNGSPIVLLRLRFCMGVW